MKDFFNSNTVDFGEVGVEDVLSFTFPFTGSPDDIDYIATGCGSCTEAIVNEQTKRIEGTLSISAAQQYVNEVTPIVKTITVYFDPDVSEFKAGEGKVRERDNTKRSTVLYLRAKVIKK